MSEASPLKLDLPLSKPVHLFTHRHGDLHVSKAIQDTGQWEIFETQLIAACLVNASNFVDVGANIGYYSMVAAGLRPTMPIWAFEPEPNNAALLLQSKALNDAHNIHFTQAGLASHNGSVDLHLSESNFGDHQIYDRGEGRQSVEVPLLNGSEFLSAHIEYIDVLKIDTQGAEFEVIAGLMPLLEKSPELQMVIEFWPFGLRQSGAHGHQLLDLLVSLALDVHIVDHIQHQLIPCSTDELRAWIDDLDKHADNEGFMNLFFGPVPAGVKVNPITMALV
jgi:FkbM family methyltransferase